MNRPITKMDLMHHFKIRNGFIRSFQAIVSINYTHFKASFVCIKVAEHYIDWPRTNYHPSNDFNQCSNYFGHSLANLAGSFISFLFE